MRRSKVAGKSSPARILLPIITSRRYHHTFTITSAPQVSSAPFPFRSVPYFTSSWFVVSNYLQRSRRSSPSRFTHSVSHRTTESARIFAADCNDYPRVRLLSLKPSLQYRISWPTGLLQIGSGEDIRRPREDGGIWCVSSMLSPITRADLVNLLRHFGVQSPIYHLMVYPAFPLPLVSDLPFPLPFRCHFAISRMRAVPCSAPGFVIIYPTYQIARFQQSINLQVVSKRLITQDSVLAINSLRPPLTLLLPVDTIGRTHQYFIFYAITFLFTASSTAIYFAFASLEFQQRES